MRRLGFTLALLLAKPVAGFAQPQQIPPAYRMIATEEAVPPAILYVVSLAESRAKLRSGRSQPWPWTLNIEGKGYRFLTRYEGHQALLRAIANKQTVDVGLGQVNWQWHGSRLGDPWQAFEPYFNLRLAATILREQAAYCANWWCAAGRYHAHNNKERAARYESIVRTRFREVFSETDAIPTFAIDRRRGVGDQPGTELSPATGRS